MGQSVDRLDSLYRRAFAPPDKRFLNPDGSATSRAFKPRPSDNSQLSVDVKSMTTPLKSVIDIEKFLLFELPVSEVFSIFGLTASHDPIAGNSAHALIHPILDDDDITPGLLARKSRRVYFF